jgi:hypothetical protein
MVTLVRELLEIMLANNTHDFKHFYRGWVLSDNAYSAVYHSVFTDIMIDISSLIK